MSWTLHQRRYRALAIVALFLAIGCIGAGTFELHRYHEKVAGNDYLHANARTATAPLTSALVALTGPGAASAAAPGDAVKYRSVRVTGSYDASGETYLGNQSEGGRQGYFVLTPLHTSAGTLLVARGFVAARSNESRPARIADPPPGTVSIVGHLYPTVTTDDRFAELGRGEVTSVNAGEQATRLNGPVYQAWLSLDAGRPGTSGLRALPGPQLSNPTGGAGEGQLMSYVVQWYVFAVLALLAPFLLARGEARDAQRRFLGVDPDEVQFDAVPDERRARRELAPADAGPTTTVARRAEAGLATTASASPRLARAQRLADRYGRSLGPDAPPALEDDGPLRRLDADPDLVPRSSKNAPHRSDDEYHGSYNDYLWQLALADGEAPDVALRPSADDPPPRPRWQSVTEHGPRIIDVPADADDPDA